MAPKGCKSMDLCASRESLISSMYRTKNLIEKKANSFTIIELETRVGMIESLFNQLNDVQGEIEKTNADSDGNKRQIYEELYVEIKSKLLSTISELNKKSNSMLDSTHNCNVSMNGGHNSSGRWANLPKLKIPSFSGKYTDWISWINTFTSLIHDDETLDKLSKFVHLRSSLDPMPLRTIEAIELTPENYDHALKLLRDRFENKAIIFQAHVRELYELPKISQQNALNLRELIDKVNAHLRALESLGTTEDIAKVLIYTLICSKIDKESLRKWEEQFSCTELPSWQQLSNYLNNRCITLENRDVNGTLSSNDKAKKGHSLLSAGNNDGRGCWFCHNQHSIVNCNNFLKLSPMQRYVESKKKSRCILCLLKAHSIKDCTAERCKSCNGMHHYLLHRGDKKGEKKDVQGQTSKHAQPEMVTPTKSAAVNNETMSPVTNYNSLLSAVSMNFLATAIVLVRKSNGAFVKCRTILDAGSQVNFMTSELARKLNMTIESDKAVISGIGNAKLNALGKIKACIKSRITNYSEFLQFTIMPAITQYATDMHVEFPKWKLPKNIELADPEFNGSKSIDMLIGVSTFFKLLSVGQIQLGESMPILQKSLLGWLVAGEYKASSSETSGSSLYAAVENNTELNELVEKFWKCESVSTTGPYLSEEDQQCEDHFMATVRRTLSGRFVVRLPFKTEHCLGESYSIALNRFRSLERKLEKDPSLKADYSKFIKEYQELGHLESVPNAYSIQSKYFMPHHAVLRPDSLSTKLRVVFDASCRSSNGVSLNDVLFVGPKLQPDLFETLIRFRCYRFVVTADISKMYRQVLVDEADCAWQCILWRDSRSKPVEVLRLKTVTYGTRPAPFLAMRCLKYLADEYKNEYPLASEVILKNFYVDDMLAGANSVNELIKLKSEIVGLLNLGKFELHKWRSNIPIETEDSIALTVPLHIDANDSSKTLGVLWHAGQDSFRFSYNEMLSTKICKRTVLSELSRLFDPLGLLNPIIVVGKLFMQELWLLRLDWDESLPQELHEKWQRYREELKLVIKFSFSRYVASIFSAEKIEIHGFSDASIRAIGCAVYIRTIDNQGNVNINLLAAKSSIAPLKALSLPRLELEGAVMLTKLIERIKGSLPMQVISFFYWTDSSVVLNWLSGHPSRWLTFVANRVAYIQEHTSRCNWWKIDSKSNPADIVSRGSWPRELLENQLWFKGPTFLQTNSTAWPGQSHSLLKHEEERLEERRTQCSLVNHVTSGIDLISQCKFANDYLKLVRTFSFIFRWCNNTRLKKALKPIIPYTSPFRVNELNMGLNYIIYNVQQANFFEEIQSLNNNSFIRSSKIQRLSPFMDNSEGVPILRVGGRLSKSKLHFKIKHPIIMPKGHHVSRALASYLHRTHLHVGPQTLLSLVRQRFWILNGRSLVQQVTRNCIVCFKHRPRAAQQLMGDLPSSRISGNIFPFQRAGVDFAGPITIHHKLRGKRPDKAYLALFVCFVTKACHLEIVSDLSTAAFLCALKRFFARRGLSTDIYCDNGTNFHGAARELRRLMVQVYTQDSMSKIQDDCAAHGVTFHFIPPSSPHIGGLWESSIKIAKAMLVRYINGASLTFEELSTVTAEIEAIMNSRPLYPMSSDPNDLEALTPGHFLIGRPLQSIPEPLSEEDLKVPPVNRWKRIHHIKGSFWLRWSREYLLSLQQRNKWQKPQPNLQPGTMVLIVDDNQPPMKWVLGRIQSTCPGKDELVRVVLVKTKSGITKRNVHKLCPLPQDM